MRFLIFLLLMTFSLQHKSFSQIPPKSQPTIVAKSNDDHLMDYIQQLNDDTEKHRIYIKNYYDQLLWTITGIGATIGLLITVFGVALVKSVKKEAQNTIKNQLSEHKTKIKEQAEETLGALKTDMQKVYAQQVEEGKKQIDKEIDAELSNFKLQLRDILQLYKDLQNKIKKPFQIKKSTSTLEYLKADGGDVSIKVEQQVEALDKDHPVAHIDHYMESDEEATVEVISSSPAHNVINDLDKHKKGIRLIFEETLKVGQPPLPNTIEWKIYNGYMKEKEWFSILQMNESIREIFVLRLPKSRPCKNIYCEKIELDETQIVAVGKKETMDETHQIIELELPMIGSGMKHKITWEF